VEESRKSRRFSPTASASFSWLGPDGLLREGHGAVRDISDRSVYVNAELAPPAGAHLDVEVHLKPLELGKTSVELYGEGTIVRIDRRGEQISGFAAAVMFRIGADGGPTPMKPESVN
jgi:hypothetical protein